MLPSQVLTPRRGTVVGSIRPKLKSSKRAIEVTFEQATNENLRALVLAIALLQFLPTCYPRAYHLFHEAQK